jgi:hypothetical protein
MSILGASGETESWPRLRQRLSSQAKGDVEWLDDLQREIAEIAVRRDDTIDDPVLRPFRSASGRTYIPVVSRTETFRLPERGGTWSSSGAESPNVIPSKVFVILVPALSRVVGFRNLADFFESDACTVYPPTSVVRVRWKRKSSGDKYSKDDLDGAPVICGANAKFKQLFDHTGAVPHPDARNAWTLDELLKRISDYVDDEVMQRLRDDQAKLQTHILFDGGDDFATEKLAILATAKEGKVRTHRYFVGKTFLPYLVAKQTVGDTSGPHEQFVLVSFVEF